MLSTLFYPAQSCPQVLLEKVDEVRSELNIRCKRNSVVADNDGENYNDVFVMNSSEQVILG